MRKENRINLANKQFALEERVDRDEYVKAVREAYKDRARQVWFIWKKMKELYPDIDAARIIREASWDFGYWQGERIAEKYAGREMTAADAVIGQSSKGGVQVFAQSFEELGDDQAIKLFHRCPHMEAVEEMGACKEEIREFCRDGLMACDHAIVAAFPGLEIDFPTTISDGEGQPCAMTIRRKDKEVERA